MNFSSIYKKLLLLAAPLMLAACSSDEADIPSIPDEEFEGIVINVPVNNPITTRGELTGQEGTVSNLTVIAYNQATDLPANTPNPTVKKVDVSALTTEYQQVPMPLKAGDYHIYVVGNVTGVDWENLSETQLQNKTIATEPLTSDSNLPMSCNYLAIRKTPSTSTTWGTPFENGLVKINPKKTTRVYADLTFAVAKVKYTVINGKAKFLTMATTAADRVQVANYATEASLMGHIDGQTIISKLSANPAKVGAKGQYYKFTGTYVDKNDDGTPKGPSDAQKVFADADKFDASKVGTTEKNEKGEITNDYRTWAYQGVIYVPERLFDKGPGSTDDTNYNDDNKALKTTVNFAFNYDTYTDKAKMEFGGKVSIPSSQTGEKNQEHNGIIRGVIYDVMAYTTEKDIAFQVRVRSWKYQDYQFDL